MGAAAIEPHIENVGDALIIGRVEGVAKIFLRPLIGPCIDALGLDRGDDASIDRFVAQRLARLAVDEQGNRNAPRPLAFDRQLCG
jgi:hypothetical protein